MSKRTWFAAIWWISVAFALAVSAQEPATLVLLSGERIGGNLIDMGAEFTFAVNGQNRNYAINNVALIDFVSGGQGLPGTEIAAIPASGHLAILKNGEVFTGRLMDIQFAGTPGRPMQLVFSTPNGERRIQASDVGRVYLARPDNSSVATTLPAPAPGSPQRTVNVPGNVQWVDSGFNVRQGETIRFSSSGEVRFSRNAEHRASPAGSLTGVMEPRAPVPSVLAGALIGRIGSGRAFAIGDQTAISMPQSGRFMLGVNDGNVRDNSGVFVVTLSR
jgi:hypothetical protein